VSEQYRKDLNAVACPGGIGEAGLAQCEQSLRAGECKEPGEEVGDEPAHCSLASMCVRRATAH
jgi:hypothetical protein